MAGDVTKLPAPPVRPLHKSARRAEIAVHNDGFLEGVCHALDELSAAGFDEAYEAMLARLFAPAPEPAGETKP